jgi:Fic family protein
MDDHMNATDEKPWDSEHYAADRIRLLLTEIEERQRTIDRHLKGPARWRGLARRELEGREAADVRKRVAMAYDALIEKAKSGVPVDVDLLLRLHEEVADGGQFRTRGVRVGKRDRVYRPHSSKVTSLVERALSRAEDGVEPPVLASTRLHLELLMIHPFSDSNGRVARLASSLILMRAGYCSTLLAAVEQHFSSEPRAYARAFKTLGAGRGSHHARWIVTALEAMLSNSARAAWFRNREDGLLETAGRVGITKSRQSKAITDYDLGKKTKNAVLLSETLGTSTPPLVTNGGDMEPRERAVLIAQVERLQQEELDEGCQEDQYVTTMLDALKHL